MITGTAPLNGARLYYEISGERQTLVLLHDGLLDCLVSGDQFEAFSRHYQTIRYDARGRGRSKRPDDEFSHVDDLHALLEYLHVDRAHLRGASNGGRVAVDFALKNPAAVDSLVLVGPNLSGYRFSEEKERRISQIFRRREKVVSRIGWRCDLGIPSGARFEAISLSEEGCEGFS